MKGPLRTVEIVLQKQLKVHPDVWLSYTQLKLIIKIAVGLNIRTVYKLSEDQEWWVPSGIG